MRTILVTGFTPFGDQEVNASWETARLLETQPPRGAHVIVEQIPTVYFKSVEAVMAVLERHPEVTDVVLLGEAGGNSRVCVEMIAVNYDDAALPDNAGVVRQDARQDADGPDGLFATLPVKAVVSHLAERGVPAYVSWSAGQFVCNHTLYGVLRGAAQLQRERALRVGFVHLPYTSQQAAAARRPGLDAASMARAVAEIAEYLAAHPAE